MFSRRTEWESTENELTEILNTLRCAGRRVIDLTVSNPTTCGFPYPGERILRALSNPNSLTYTPEARGLPAAREAVVRYYHERGRDISADDIFLTASTSESYSMLFRLLCDPDDSILVPRPSYPLFDFLSTINDLKTIQYRIVYDERWATDIESLRAGLLHSPRAVVLTNPHNPTGSFLSSGAWKDIRDAAHLKGVALIVDEVFIDYAFDGAVVPGAREPDPRTGPLTFYLNGLSKSAALPQMKLGWIAVTGGGSNFVEAKSRLEILNDTFLSANTPVQASLPEFLAVGNSVRPSILKRVTDNYAFLRHTIGDQSGCTVLSVEGGWNAIVRLPVGMDDAGCVTSLLNDVGVYCYPGFFFDFEEDNLIILSLIVPSDEFRDGVTALVGWIVSRTGVRPG